jgi:saxitoxin biosynthesis operon SxtJ-like protein
MDQSTHENLDRDEPNSPGSDRTFGLVMAVALSLVGAINFYHSGWLWRWELALAALLLAAAWLMPRLLYPLNRLWMKLGLVLHRIVNPIVMGLLFYGTIWPTGLVMRMRGKDLLRLKREPSSNTYWISRAPGPQPDTMKDQF